MNSCTPFYFWRAVLVFLFVIAAQDSLKAQGTAFSYQGRLLVNSNAPTGNYDMQFKLHPAATGTNQIGPTLVVSPVGVTNGLFLVTLDFGGVYNGSSLYLEIGVRTNGSASNYTVLSPTQPLTPTPYAVLSENTAVYSGPVADSQLSANVALLNTGGAFTAPVSFTNASGNFNGNLSGTFTGNGNGLTNIPVSAIPSLSSNLGVQSANIISTNLVPPDAVYTNDTNFGADYYSLTVTPGLQYFCVITNSANIVFDPNNYYYQGSSGLIIPAGNVLWCVDGNGTLVNKPVEEQVYADLTNTIASSNIVSTGNIAANNITSTTINGGTINAGRINGTFVGVAGQITLNGSAPPNLADGFLPLPDSLMDRQMPVPTAMWSTYLMGTNVNGATITNMVNALVTNGLVAAGWNWIEIDSGWQQTNFVRSQHPGSTLNCNSNLFPQGMTAVCNYAHANGVKIMLYTFYSDEGCGYPIGGIAGSPPGFLYGDLMTMASWGVDGVNVDSCNIGYSEQALRQMYIEMDNGISHVNAHPAHDDDASGKIFPARSANIQAGAQQYSWTGVEGNIIFDGTTGTESPLQADWLNNWSKVYANSWIIRPGHYYTIDNLAYDLGTNTLMYQMTMMAILPSPALIGEPSTNMTAENIPWYNNGEIIGIYQDPAVIPGVLLSNVPGAGPIFERQLGCQSGPIHAVAFLNTNASSSQVMTINTAMFGLTNNPILVRDVWNRTNLGIFTNAFNLTVPANSARLFTFTANPSYFDTAANPLSLNMPFTNGNSSSTLNVNYILTSSSATGFPGLIFTNMSTGYTATLSNSFAITGSQYLSFQTLVGPNEVVYFTNVSSGAASASISSSWIWSK